MESVTVPIVKDKEDERMCEIEVNKAILALKLNGGGPSHINLYTRYSNNFSIKELPFVNVIYRHTNYDKNLPQIPSGKKLAVYIGSHYNMDDKLTEAIDKFCSTYNAAVFCDHTSGYRGKYELHYQLVCCQKQWYSPLRKVDLCIHIGEVTGDPYKINSLETWRVSPDGALRDTFGNLTRVFMMDEESFFNRYAKDNSSLNEYYNKLCSEIDFVKERIPELPFSNIWIAQYMVDKLPKGCELHFGIYHSLRSWDFFKFPKGILGKSNVGGFGIDGGVSSMIGSSLLNPHKLYIGIFGDLAFFYDMNVIGNKHIGSNVRILLINNGKGNEFRNYGHPCYFLGDEADKYIAGAGHFGNKSSELVKHYATDLGYEYLSSNNKGCFIKNLEHFLSEKKIDKPIIFEVFTNTEDESNALEYIQNIIVDDKDKLKKQIKSTVKRLIGEKPIKAIKRIIK